MILSNKLAKGKPKKNLIPDFTSDRWFQDSTVAGGTPIFDINNPYKMQFSMTQPAQARLIWIPVELGKAYTFSFGKITGLYRLYKGKVTAHGGTVLVQDATPKPFTFVVDSAYNGFVTLRITQGIAGTFSFENLQLEEGYATTKFEPYKEVIKASRNVPKKNLVPPFSKWNRTSSFTINSDYKITGQFTAGTIRSCDITLDVEVGKTYILSGKVTPTNGRIRVGKKSDNTLIGVVGANGTPTLVFTATERQYLLSIDNNYGSPVFGGTLVFENIQLEEGKNASEFKPYELTSKKATLVPRKNLIKPFTSKEWEMNPKFKVVSGTEGTLSSTVAGWDTSKIQVPVQIGKTYTVQADIEGKFSIEVWENGRNFGSFTNNSTQSRNLTAGYSKWEVRIVRDGQAIGDFRIKNLMVSEGTTRVPFVPYEETAKKANLDVVKAPYRNYPFNFKRESIEVFEGIQYGYNNPRLKDGGVFIEEPTTNMYVVGNGNIGTGFAYTNQDGWHKVTNNTAGSGATASMGLRFVVDLSKLTNGTTYACSATVYNPNDFPVDVHQDWCDVNQNPFNVTTIQPKETRRISVVGARSQYDATYRFYDFAPQGNGNTLWVKDVQIEKKAYSTSYTLKERKYDVASANVIMDKLAGAIEVEFEWLDNPSKSQYIYDTDSGRFILYKDVMDNKLYVYIDSNSIIALPKSVLPTGKVTARVEWKNSVVTLFINGVNVGTGSYPSADFTSSRNLYIGSRFTMVEHLNNVIYSFKIEDRYGNITYEI